MWVVDGAGGLWYTGCQIRWTGQLYHCMCLTPVDLVLGAFIGPTLLHLHLYVPRYFGKYGPWRSNSLLKVGLRSPVNLGTLDNVIFDAELLVSWGNIACMEKYVASTVPYESTGIICIIIASRSFHLQYKPGANKYRQMGGVQGNNETCWLAMEIWPFRFRETLWNLVAVMNDIH